MTRRACIVPLLLVILGCGTETGPPGEFDDRLQQTMKFEATGGTFCCDPSQPLPQEIGTLRITNTGQPIENDVRVDIEVVDPFVTTDAPATFKLVPGDVYEIKISAIGTCEWDTAKINVGVLPTGNLMDADLSAGTTVLVTNACGPLGHLFTMGSEIFPSKDVGGLVGDSVTTAVVGIPVPWSAPRVDPRIPFLLWVEINRFGAFLEMLGVTDVEDLFVGNGFQTRNHTGTGNPAYPCGAGDHAFTVCPAMPAPIMAGEFIFAYLSVEQDIPISSNRFRTYGFVFDSDGDATNNYVPNPAFPDDYFKDTDRWYVVDYVPGAGWTLHCRDATNSVITDVSTAARALVLGNVMLLVAPRSEFGVDEPRYRVTAFTHTGDFGSNPPHDWAGDQHPRVAEGLAPFARDD